jgi:hypothetical protein
MRRLIPRKFERQRFLGPAEVQPLLAGSSLRAMVLNLGQSGVAIFANRSLEVGELVEVSFCLGRAAERRDVMALQGRVVRCRAQTEGNILGIAFARPIGADELELLETHWARS